MIIGGTGLVGKELTTLLLADERYSKVVLLVRKPLATLHQKLVQVAYNFDHPDTSVVVADELFSCLGTTIKDAGNKTAFYKVDHDYIVDTAKAGFKNGIKKFALVSSMGADKKSRIFYNKTKGETEDAVSTIGFEAIFIFRPSLLLGSRANKRIGESIAQFLMSALAFAIPRKYKAIKGSQVARAMVAVMNSDYEGVHIFESDAIASL